MTLEKLQSKLRDEKIEALIVTRNNMFLGQDILPEENKIEELTGFTGSAGTLLVTQNHCFLLVDGRYHIQSRLETNPEKVSILDCGKAVLKTLISLCINQNIEILAYNPWCLSVNDVNLLKKTKFNLIADENILGSVLSEKPVECFPDNYAGKSNLAKCELVAQQIQIDADAMLICAADQVSWLANIRSNALPETPILRAFAILNTHGKIRLFADNVNNTAILPLSEIQNYLTAYAHKTIVADFSLTPQKIADILPENVTLKPLTYNPLVKYKTAKNTVELEGFKQAHIRDGIAVTKFLCWLDSHWKKLTELDVVAKLHEFRSRQPLFYSESFATIAATAENSAIVHYHPTEKSNKKLQKNSVLLLDSGGQYLDGTTDVTRTIALGQPSKEMINSFTQVLKAHIALAAAAFPDGTPGYMLDAVARHTLWRFGKDYQHGTGHSVGHFSNVHEAPFAISSKNSTKIHSNYVTSNEPGYYKEGHFGIRIENMVYAHPREDSFLVFSNLTLIPIDKRLINPYLLTAEERDWLNNYHQEVWNCLAPMMDNNEKIWLESACSPL